MISVDDAMWFIDEAIDGLIDVVGGLGDDLANRRLDVPGSNSPYALLSHCLGVMEYWGGHVIAGRAIERDRDAEFRASGPVAPLIERTAAARSRLAADVADLDPVAPPRGKVQPDDALMALGRTRGGALIHIYEELAQHRGQVEVSADVLRAPWVRTLPPG